jgi:hypothetical protein
LSKLNNFSKMIGLHEDEELVDASGRVHHPKIQCDGCGANPIVGIRYRCLNCPNFVRVDCLRITKSLESM